MDKSLFFKGIQETLELTREVNEDTLIHLTSLSTLVIIAFVDENFKKRVKVADIKNIKNVSDLMNLIGMDNFFN
jgi:acyl carrier protein